MDNKPEKRASLATIETVLADLANPIKLELLIRLIEGEKDVSTLADQMDLDHSSISHYLRTLREHCLVEVKPHHQHRYYRLGKCIRAVVKADAINLVVTDNRGDELVLKLHRTP